MPIFGQKTSILLKLHYFMVIKVNRMLFLFRFFTKKSLLSCPYFIKNTSILLKHTALIPILVKKNFHSLKNTVLSCAFFFSNFSWKTPAVVHMIGQKTSILSKLHYFMVIKVKRMLFLFRFFMKKSLLSCSYFIKNTSILLKHTALIPILVKKTSILSKTRCSHVFFFSNFS